MRRRSSAEAKTKPIDGGSSTSSRKDKVPRVPRVASIPSKLPRGPQHKAEEMKSRMDEIQNQLEIDLMSDSDL